MKIVYQQQSTASIHYGPLEKLNTVRYKGEEYRKEGISYQPIGWAGRLWRLTQLISRIAIGFFLAFIPYAFSSFRKSIGVLGKEIAQGKEKVHHYVPIDPGAAQIKEGLQAPQLLASNVASLNIPNIQTAKCFVDMHFLKGRIQQEFLFKSANGTAYDSAALSRQVSAIIGFLKAKAHAFGNYTKAEWLMLIQDANGKYAKADVSHSGIGPKSASVPGLNAAHIDTFYKQFVDKTDYPKEQQILNGNFVPGTNCVVFNV